MNSVQLLGNMTSDPDVRYTRNGNPVASFSLACNRNYVTPDKEKKQLTDFVRCIVWGNQAEALGKMGHKGMRLFALGRQSTRSYEKNGEKHYITEIVCEFIGVPVDTVGANPAAPGESFDDMGQETKEDVPF